MMTTYWVQGVRDGASPGPTPPPSPRPQARNFLTPSPSLKKISPEPHQWPQADLLARRRSTEPHDLLTQRRGTLTVECPALQSLPAPTLECPAHPSRLGSVLQLSELNLLRVRNSLSLGGLRLEENELTRFAALAEENAQQARLVADAAHDMVRRVSGVNGETRSPPDTGQPQTDTSSYSCVIL